MELRVEAADDSRLPPGCVVSVRIGDVLKQGRYEASRCYQFPVTDRRRNAKVDLYQHIGSCVVGVDPETKSTHQVTVTSVDPAFPTFDLKVHSQAKGGEIVKEKREEQVKAMKSQAKDYLVKHRIDEKLSEAVKQLLKNKPEDPTEFLIKHLRAAEDARQAVRTTEAAAPPAVQAEGTPLQLPNAIAPLRQKALDALTRASRDGELQRFLGTPIQLPNAIAPLRQKALDALTRASRDGELQRLLGESSKPRAAPDAAAGESSKPRAAPDAAAASVPPATSQPTQQPAPSALRQQAADALISAALNGDLLQVLQEHNTKKRTEAYPEGAARPSITFLLAQAREGLCKANGCGQLQQVLQEVKAESQAGMQGSPGMMLPSATLQGPAFAGMGMTPGLVFV